MTAGRGCLLPPASHNMTFRLLLGVKIYKREIFDSFKKSFWLLFKDNNYLQQSALSLSLKQASL